MKGRGVLPLPFVQAENNFWSGIWGGGVPVPSEGTLGS